MSLLVPKKLKKENKNQKIFENETRENREKRLKKTVKKHKIYFNLNLQRVRINTKI